MKIIKINWVNSKRNLFMKIIGTFILIGIVFAFKFTALLPKKKRFLFLRTNQTKDSNIIPMYEFHKAKGDNVHLIDSRVNKQLIKTLFMSSTSKYIYLDDVSSILFAIPLRKINILQLWHGSGSIKSVGLFDNSKRGKIYRKIGMFSPADLMIVESENIKEEISEAFGVKLSNMIVTTPPRQLRNKINNKEGILFCPTFRKKNLTNYYPEEFISFEELKYLGKKLFIRFHPRVSNIKIPYWATDASSLTMEECVRNTNIIVSDYSSIVVDYLAMSKNAHYISYAPDIKSYEKERGLMPSWKNYMSDQIAINFDELKDYIKEPTFTNVQYLNKIGLNLNNSSLEIIRNMMIKYKKK